jgi:hypothetical protein
MMDFGLTEADMQDFGIELMQRGVDFTALVYDLSEEGLSRIDKFVNAVEDILVGMGRSKVEEIGGKPNENITSEKIGDFLN